MNEYDSNKMADVLKRSHGFERTDDPEEADLLLLNTCSIREKAQERVFSELGRWKTWKAADPKRLIGVGGCVASQEGEALSKRAKIVDIVFGPQTLHRLPALIDMRIRTKRPAVDISFPEIEKFDYLPKPTATGPTAFVSVMEGCSKYCSFCIVPYTRGEEVSRPLIDVLSEIQQLADQGVREVTLLGQNVNAYCGITPDGDTVDLSFLVSCIAHIEKISRIRFTTSHPAEFNDSLVESFATEPKLAGYLHLPVQSGSDRILGLMKRGYTRQQFLEKIGRLRAIHPNISLSTDLIVGFPSETESDFQDTLDLIDQAGFDAAYSFIYSPRPGTPAANLVDNVSQEIKQKRLAILQDLVRKNGREYARRLLGTTQSILVQKPSLRNRLQLAGKTACNRWVNFDGPLDLIGQFVNVRIDEIAPNSLRGTLMRKTEADACIN